MATAGNAIESHESVFGVLTKQHREVDDLFEQVELAADEPVRARRLFEQLAELLRAHAHAEEAVLYPRLAQVETVASTIAHGRHEHAEIERHLEDLRGHRELGNVWRTGLHELAREVRHHVATEEVEVFAAGRQALTHDEALALGAELRRVLAEIAPGLVIPPVGVASPSVGAPLRR